MTLDQLIDWLGASAGLGTAAFGVVEALKGTPLGVIGVGMIKRRLGPSLITALERVYGEGVERMIEDTFRRGASALSEFLKNGLRMALTSESADALAKVVRQEPAKLELAVATLQGRMRDPEAAMPTAAEEAFVLEQRAVVGRFELAIDARVDAAVAAAQEMFATSMRLQASFVAIAAGVSVGFLAPESTSPLQGLLIGVLAIPLAPIAKDLIGVLEAARTALVRRNVE